MESGEILAENLADFWFAFLSGIQVRLILLCPSDCRSAISSDRITCRQRDFKLPVPCPHSAWFAEYQDWNKKFHFAGVPPANNQAKSPFSAAIHCSAASGIQTA